MECGTLGSLSYIVGQSGSTRSMSRYASLPRSRFVGRNGSSLTIKKFNPANSPHHRCLVHLYTARNGRHFRHFCALHFSAVKLSETSFYRREAKSAELRWGRFHRGRKIVSRPMRQARRCLEFISRDHRHGIHTAAENTRPSLSLIKHNAGVGH